MSIFGDLDTPTSKKPEPPVKQLVELSIKPHIQFSMDERGKVLVPALQALLDPPTQTVTVRAETKTAFADGTTGDGIAVTFFFNGKRLCDVKTDDFGIALLEHPIPANLFTMNWQVDELTARVRGFAKEASAKVQVLKKQITLTVAHRWMTYTDYLRYDDLELTVRVKETRPLGFTFQIQEIVVLVERFTDFGQYETLAKGTLDSANMCTINLPYCYDHYLTQQRLPRDLSWSRSSSNSGGVRIRLKDWPNEAAPFQDYGPLHLQNASPPNFY